MTAPRLVLASASPARLGLLRAAGITPEVVVSGVDESVVPPDDAATVAGTLARLKGEAVAALLRSRGRRDALVLGCDSVLAFGGRVLGKPADAAEARRRWREMRGGTGVLHTGHSLTDLADGRQLTRVAATTVRFARVGDDEIDAYVATGEPLHVAGAFTLDGRSAPFVEGIDGDPGNVIGLSLPLLRVLLAELGTPITSLWESTAA
ncbi:Maf family protein [Pilimelia terevasa]|uniref:Maf family protein n=1 Tax=Pilimelia terevasa TaxID=53372 RepID=UPI00166A7751|nr:Maf family protein [Pilimelia terevasa]